MKLKCKSSTICANSFINSKMPPRLMINLPQFANLKLFLGFSVFTGDPYCTILVYLTYHALSNIHLNMKSVAMFKQLDHCLKHDFILKLMASIGDFSGATSIVQL